MNGGDIEETEGEDEILGETCSIFLGDAVLDNKILQPRSSFFTGSGCICGLFLSNNNLKEKADIHVVWRCLDNKKPFDMICEKRLIYDPTSDRIRNENEHLGDIGIPFKLDNSLDVLVKGSYCVEIYIDGTLQKTKNFECVERLGLFLGESFNEYGIENPTSKLSDCSPDILGVVHFNDLISIGICRSAKIIWRKENDKDGSCTRKIDIQLPQSEEEKFNSVRFKIKKIGCFWEPGSYVCSFYMNGKLDLSKRIQVERAKSRIFIGTSFDGMDVLDDRNQFESSIKVISGVYKFEKATEKEELYAANLEFHKPYGKV